MYKLTSDTKQILEIKYYKYYRCSYGSDSFSDIVGKLLCCTLNVTHGRTKATT